jgi:hypothetical protein
MARIGSKLKVARWWTNPRLWTTRGGARAGARLAPDGLGMQGAVLGGGLGFLGPGMLAGTQPMPTKTIIPDLTPTKPVQRGPNFSKFSSEFTLGTNIPGTPIGVGIGFKPKDERLAGMHGWVPRDTIERASHGLEQGLDPRALMDLEAQQGSLRLPLLGAGAAAALTKYKLPSAGNFGAAIAGLAGGGAAALYHKHTEGDRREQMLDALRGLYRERGFPLRGQHDATANEPQPMLVSRGGGSAR